MDKVVHFEIPADDIERAQNFYKNIFQWDVNFVPEFSYVIVHTTETDENQMILEKGAINGGMMKRGLIKNPVITIQVDNIDQSLAQIEQAGGKQIGQKQQVGDMGFSAYFQDTEGNILGLWENIKK